MLVIDGEPRRALRSTMRPFFTVRGAKEFEESLDSAFRSSLDPRWTGRPSTSPPRSPGESRCWSPAPFSASPPQTRTSFAEWPTRCSPTPRPGADPGHTNRQGASSRGEILAYFHELIQSLTVRTGGGLAAELLGSGLEFQDTVLNLLSVLIAATETTRLSSPGR